MEKYLGIPAIFLRFSHPTFRQKVLPPPLLRHSRLELHNYSHFSSHFLGRLSLPDVHIPSVLRFSSPWADVTNFGTSPTVALRQPRVLVLGSTRHYVIFSATFPASRGSYPPLSAASLRTKNKRLTIFP